jgi:3-phytase
MSRDGITVSVFFILAFVSSGCGVESQDVTRVGETSVAVGETYRNSGYPADDVDSLAVWHGPAGEHWVLATAKATHRLLVFEAASGELVNTFGGEGDGAGEFRRPNGIAVVGNIVLVVERDNARVQGLNLPELESLGFIGAQELTRPYGLSVFASDAGYELYVTDNYDAPETLEERNARLAGTLDRRIRHYRIALNDRNELVSESVGAFGDTAGEGVLWKVETLLADPENHRLLVADELENRIKIYDLDGRFTGASMGEGYFHFEPEGLALLRCGDGGWWIGVDQEERRSHFRIFDRGTLQYVGTFTGEVTANTDGVAATQEAFGPFARGAFFAVHDDSALSAFDLALLSRRLNLDIDCSRKTPS